jgi:hypothetical protein
MVDFGGAFRNSATRTVKGSETNGDYTIFPNPVRSNGTVYVSDISEPITIQLIDNSGRVVKNLPMINTNVIELKNIQNGMYQVRIRTESTGSVVTRKLIIAD